MKKFSILVLCFLFFASSLSLGGVKKNPAPKRSPMVNQKLPSFLRVLPLEGGIQLSFRDFAFGGASPRLVLDRYYNPSFHGILGRGWQLAIEAKLRIYPQKAQLVTPQGKRIWFIKNSSGLWQSQTGRPGQMVTPSTGDVKIRWRDGEIWSFGTRGRLTSRLNSHKEGWKIFYGKKGPKQMVDSRGHSLEFFYDKNHLKKVRDSLGREVHYGYNARGLLRGTEDFRGWKYTFVYEKNLLSKILPPSQNTLQFKYNSKKRLGEIAQNGHTLYSYQYKTNPQTTLIQDGSGMVRKIVLHRKKGGKIIQWDGYTLELNSFEDPLSLTTPLGKYNFRYDGRRNLISVTTPLKKKLSYLYDRHNRLKGLKNFLGYTRKFTYDNLGNLKGFANVLHQWTRLTWDQKGRLVGLLGPGGQKVKFGWDRQGHLQKVIDGLGREEKRIYDGRGRLSTIVGAGGGWVKIKYNRMNQPVEISNSAGQCLRYTYDGLGNLRCFQDPQGGKTLYSYDKKSQLTLVKNSLGQSTELGYDPWGHLKMLGLPGGKKVTFHHDRKGHLTRMTTLEGGIFSYKYDSLGRLIERTYPDGKKTHYFWKGLKNLVAIHYPNGDKALITYDGLGRILSMKNRASHLIYLRDEMGRVLESRDEILGQSTLYSYDKSGRMDSIQTPFGTLKYKANRVGWLKSIQWGLKKFQFSYSNSGSLADLIYPNGMVSTWIHNPSGRLLEWILRKKNNIFHREKYTYNLFSSITATRSLTGNLSHQYDQLNRLRGLQTRGRSSQFRYDPLGNLVKRTRGPYSIQGTFQDDKITQWGKIKFTYDRFGRITEKIGPKTHWSYQYDYENRLVQVSNNQGLSLRYGYTVDGRMAWREINGQRTSFLYQGKNILAEYHKGILRKGYIYGPRPDMVLAVVSGGKASYLHQDGRWNVRALSDEKGQILRQWEYGPFGSLLSSKSSGNPYLFGGRRLERETGLYYHRARFYDPQTGRFLTPDPLGYLAGVNRYIYCGNNPINFRDPQGKFLHIVAGAVIGGLVWGGVNIAFQLWDNGGNFREVDWGEVAGSVTSGAVAGGIAAATAGLGLAWTSTTMGAMAVEGGSLSVGEMAGRVVTNLWHRRIDKEDVRMGDGVVFAGIRGLVTGGLTAGLFEGVGRGFSRAKRYLDWSHVSRLSTTSMNHHLSGEFYRSFAYVTLRNAISETLMMRSPWGEEKKDKPPVKGAVDQLKKISQNKKNSKAP